MSFKKCPTCGRIVDEDAVICRFCGHPFSNETWFITDDGMSPDAKVCPQCGAMIKKDTEVCSSCGNAFSKTKRTPKTDSPAGIKHFDDGTVSFDYPDDYSRDLNPKYGEIGVLASFKKGPDYAFDSAFAVFDGEPNSDEIPDSKFEEVTETVMDSDVLDIHRYVFADKERIIIKIENSETGNIEYRCNVPQIGFSALFIISKGKEDLFDKKCISMVVNSLEISEGEPIPESEMADELISNNDESETKCCSHCGAEVTSLSMFCPNCGKLV